MLKKFRMLAYVLSVLLLNSVFGNDHCPNDGKTLTLPRTNEVPNNIGPGEVFDIDIEGFGGDPEDALAFTGEIIQIDPNSALVIERKNVGQTFRLMGFDFSIEFADSVTFQVFTKNGGMVLNVPIFLAGNQLAVRILRDGATILGGFHNQVLLPADGIANVETIIMYFSPSIINQDISLFSIFVSGCTHGGFGGAGPDSIQSNDLTGGAIDGGFKLATNVEELGQLADAFSQRNPTVGALLIAATDELRNKTHVLDPTDDDWIFDGQPEMAGDLTRWLQTKNAEVQDLLHEAIPLLLAVEDIANSNGLSERELHKTENHIDAVFKSIYKTSDEVLGIGNQYIYGAVVSTGFGLWQKPCTAASDCRPGYLCCHCKCRRPDQCRYLDAQEDLKECVDNRIELAFAQAAAAATNADDILCSAADAIGGEIGNFLLDLKFYMWIQAWLDDPIPNGGTNYPGKPPFELQDVFIRWMVGQTSALLEATYRSRDAIRDIMNHLNANPQSTVNPQDVWDGLNRLMLAYDAIDEALLETTTCYIDYALDTVYYLPDPQ